MTVEQLQTEIKALPRGDFQRLRRWILDIDLHPRSGIARISLTTS